MSDERTTPQHHLRCPKCAGEMMTYERSGVLIDQCRECRGIFLDRGELERLLDLEASAIAGPALEAAGPPPGAPRGYGWHGRGPRRHGNYDDDTDDDDDRRRGGRRRGFLSDLLDGIVD